MDVDVSAMGDDARRQVGRPLCGIDPGRDKFGVAIVSDDRLDFSAIVPAFELDAVIGCMLSGNWEGLARFLCEGTLPQDRVERIYLGDGTGSEAFEKKFVEKGIECCMIDERMTTLEAERLYWSLHPPGGLWRLLPRALLPIPRSVDDLAAWAIVRKAQAGFR